MNRAYLLFPSLVAGIIILFVPLTPLQAQQPDWAKVHSVTMSSIESLYNLNFEEAEARANEVIKLAPQDPRGYFFRAIILSIRVDGRYVEVKCYRENRAQERLLLMRSLESLEERLPPEMFFRASRNELVNLNRITNVEAWFGGTMLATLEDGTKIEISRRQAQKFKETMSL